MEVTLFVAHSLDFCFAAIRRRICIAIIHVYTITSIYPSDSLSARNGTLSM